MSTENNINFDLQKLIVSNESWKVELCYESEYEENRVIDIKDYSKIIDISDSGYLGSFLLIITTNKLGEIKRFLISGIDGGCYFHIANDNDKSQTLKLIGDNLILSLGFTFFSLNIEKQEIEWKLRPDMAEIFEYYDLQDDFLLRGELQIHRIDKKGNIKWSYGGRDIWVSIDGKKEVNIENEKIVLTDFEGNVYVIDYNGKIIEDSPFDKYGNKKKWWEFWK